MFSVIWCICSSQFSKQLLALKLGFSGAVLVIPAGGCSAGSGVIGVKREMCQGPWCLLQWDKANCTCRGSRALKAHISRKTNRNAVRQITGTWLRLNKDQSWVNTNGGVLRFQKKEKKSNQHRAAYSRGNSWAICFLNSYSCDPAS